MSAAVGSYADRKTAQNNLGSTGTCTIATIDIKGVVRDATHTQQYNMIDVRAINDPGVWQKVGTKSGTLEFECANEGAEIMVAAFDAKATVAFTHTILGTAKSGSAVISSHTRGSGGVDGAPTERFTLQEMILS
jgi:hypothetical protein